MLRGLSVSARVPQRNRTSRSGVCVCVCIKYLLFIYFEELVYVILELASMKSAEQAGNSGRNSCCSLEAEFLLSWKNFSFCSLKPSTNWIRPHHVIEGNLHQLK